MVTRPSTASLLSFTLFALLFSFVMTSAAQDFSGSYSPRFAPGYRPDPGTDEGGFWYQVDKIEAEIKQSPRLVNDPELNEYVHGVVCKITPDYCPFIRVYIVRNPHFNASMYPNGMMHVWTGLLMRVDSEAQLATVLGHEIAHYLLTHSISQWRKMRSGFATAMVFDVLLTGGLASLAVAGNSLSFNRQQEEDADFFGLHMMANAGYQPSKASELWQYLEIESENDESKENYSSFWSTHPKSKDRAKQLLMRGESLKHLENEYITNQQDYVARLSSEYFSFMTDHMNMQELGQSEVLLQRQLQLGFPPGQVNFFLGETYRLRNQDGDLNKAVSAYKKALTYEDSPPITYRELGYLLTKLRDPSAVEYLRRYKELDPDASDIEMVDFYINSYSQ